MILLTPLLPFQLLYYMVYDIIWTIKHKKFITLFGVWLYVGEVGSGKTMSMVQQALHYKRRDKNIAVWANFPCEFADHQWTDWSELYSMPSYSIVLVSEAGLLLNNRDWSSFPQGLIELLTQNRKWGESSDRPPGVRMLVDCQDIEMVDKILRRMTNVVVHCSPYWDFGNGPRLIFQKWYRPAQYYRAEGVRKSFSFYGYIATNKLRNGYQTYYKITK